MESLPALSEMRIKLGSRLMVVVTAGSFALALALGLSQAFYLFYLLCLLWGVAYLWTRWASERVWIERRPETNWVQAGDEFSETFLFHNQSRLPLLWLEVVDHSSVPGYSASRVESAGSGETRTWVTIGRCLRRGLYALGPTELRTGDPFGLFASELVVPATRSLLVFPPIVHLPELQLPPGSATGASRSNLRTAQPTSSIAGIRSYLPGDPVNRISWHHTAHTGDLQVKESELEPSRSLWVVLDLDEAVQSGEGDDSTLECGVKVAASAAYRAISEGRAVGLSAWPHQVQPERGARQMRRILETLAMVSANAGPRLTEVLARAAGGLARGASIVIVTPSLEPAWADAMVNLGQRGLAPVCILLESGAGGQAQSEAYAALRARLFGIGVPALVIRSGELVETLAPSRRKRRARYRVLGTGRAVAVESQERPASVPALKV